MVTFKEYNNDSIVFTQQELRDIAKIITENFSDIITEQELLNEGWLKSFLYSIAQIIDPTGVLSWPDLYRAITQFNSSNSFWTTLSSLRVLLALFMVIPNIGVIKGALAGGAAGTAAAGVGAAPGAAVGAAAGGTAWGALRTGAQTIVKDASLAVVQKIPGFKKYISYLSGKASTVLSKKPVMDLLTNMTSKFAAAGKLTGPQTEVLLKAVENIGSQTAASAFKKGISVATGAGKGSLAALKTKFGASQAVARAAGSVMPGTGKAAAEEIKRKLDPYRTPEGQRLTVPGQPTGGTQTAQASVGAQQEPQETLTYTDPKTGQQFQGTADEFRSLGILPIQAPQQQSYPFASTGVQLTPAQQQAIGGFSPRGGTQRTGQIVPQNVPQGATQQNPFGREGMSPAEYMTPDNFNNPPVPQPNQRGYSPNQQQYGLGNLVGDVGNTVAGTVGGLGALAGQLAATPIAGVTNLASGLLGLIPGIGGSTGMGMNPYQMTPQGYNPNQYYRSPQGYNPYNYPPYGYPQR